MKDHKEIKQTRKMVYNYDLILIWLKIDFPFYVLHTVNCAIDYESGLFGSFQNI